MGPDAMTEIPFMVMRSMEADIMAVDITGGISSSEPLKLVFNSIQYSVYVRFNADHKRVRLTDAGILVCVQ